MIQYKWREISHLLESYEEECRQGIQIGVGDEVSNNLLENGFC